MSIIDITSKCNLSCVYCCRGKHSLSPSQQVELKTEELMYAINEIIRNRGSFVVLQGGEPLLGQDIVKIIEDMGHLKETRSGYFLAQLKTLIAKQYLADQFMLEWKKILINQKLPLFCVTTNGTIYRDEIENALYHSGFSVEVSLDSPYAETNIMTRRGLDFDQAVENIKQYNRRNPVEISSTVTEANVSQMLDMLKFTLDLGCICLKYSPVIMIGSRVESTTDFESQYFDSLDQVSTFMNQNQNIFVKVKMMTHMLKDMRGKEVYDKLVNTKNVLIELHACNAFKDIKDAYIDTDLNVFGCASMKNDKALSIGNLRNHSLNELWRSSKRSELRKLVQAYENEDGIYGSCTSVKYLQTTKRS